MFNTFFVQISESISQTINTRSNAKTHKEYIKNHKNLSSSFFMGPLIESDIKDAILKLKNSPCLDKDGLNSKMIKSSIGSLTGPLTL